MDCAGRNVVTWHHSGLPYGCFSLSTDSGYISKIDMVLFEG